MFTTVAFILFIPSQIFWLWQLRALGRKLIHNETLRSRLGWTASAIYGVFLVLNFALPRTDPDPSHLTLRAALLQAPSRWWLLSSLLGLALYGILLLVGSLAEWAYSRYQKLRASSAQPKGALLSPQRRQFLTRAAVAVSATPFAACAYGLVYERFDIETTHQRIFLKQLPKAFDGFRIAQVSDIHIGPFMPEDQIRRCAAMINGLKPDLIALTGDYITWEGSPQLAVVNALSGLRAPFGVFGCLGNHEIYAEAEDSITKLFTERGTKILRYKNAAIETSGEHINLIGVDYESRLHLGFGKPEKEGFVKGYLQGVDSLMSPGTVNILLSHNPNTFDRAAQLGIDLSLAGHTHGGQVSMEYISPNLSPAALITRYVRGWFKQGDSQLYVNRGIGTIFSPIRVDCPPEITVYELKRA
jgi:uncharacterized protein